MKKTKICVVFLTCLLFSTVCLADVITFSKTVDQLFGWNQAPDDVRILASSRAKVEVLKQAGTYLEGLPVVKNNRIEKDEILALAAAASQMEIVPFQHYATKDGFGITVEVKLDFEKSNLEEQVEELLQDRSLLKKYQEIQRREKEVLSRIGKLEEQNRQLSTISAHKRKKKKEDLKEQFRKVAKELTAVEWNQKALDYWKEGNYFDPDRALNYLNEAVRLDPKSADAHYNRGIAYDGLGKNQQAIKDYNQALQLDPKHTEVYYKRGIAFSKLGKHKEAKEDFSQVIRLDPKNPDAYYNRGIACDGLGKFHQAVKDYNQAVGLDPKRTEAFYRRGIAFRKLGKYSEAKKDFNKVIRLDPKNADAYYNRGIACDGLGKYQQSIEDYSKAVRLNPKHTEAFYSRGIAYRKSGK